MTEELANVYYLCLLPFATDYGFSIFRYKPNKPYKPNKHNKPNKPK